MFISGYSTTVSASALQAEDVGSIPITRSNLKRFWLLTKHYLCANAKQGMHTQEEFAIRLEEGMRLMINGSSPFSAFILAELGFTGTGISEV